MNKRALLTLGAGAILALTAAGPAMAFGHHGPGGPHGGDDFGVLARAAGITHDQIHNAFMNDANLKTDFQNVMTTKKAMDSCIIGATSATACNSQIQAYAAAQQALTTEQNTVWTGLFASAPNKSAAASLKGQLDQLEAQKHQILHQAFSSAKGSDSSNTSAEQ